jgi:hypothetical protein
VSADNPCPFCKSALEENLQLRRDNLELLTARVVAEQALRVDQATERAYLAEIERLKRKLNLELAGLYKDALRKTLLEVREVVDKWRPRQGTPEDAVRAYVDERLADKC